MEIVGSVVDQEQQAEYVLLGVKLAGSSLWASQ